MRGCTILFLGVCGLSFSVVAPAQTVMSIAEEDTADADRYFAQGERLTFHARYDSANFCFEKAAAIYAQAAVQVEATSLWKKYVKCCNQIGDNFRLQDRHKEALEYLNKALEVGAAKLGENHPEVATAYDNIGRVYWYKGESASALHFCTRALDLRLRVRDGNHPDVARSYESMGYALLFSSQYDEALKYFQNSLIIRRQRFGENSLPVASSYHALGRYFYFTKDIDELYKYANKSLSIKRRLLDESHPEVADTYNDIGNYYYYTGNYEKAIEYYDRARIINHQAYGYYHQYVARSYVNNGHVFHARKEYDNAIAAIQKAGHIFLAVFGENQWVANNCQYKGEVYSSKGDYDKALQSFAKSLAINEKIGGLEVQTGRLYAGIAEVYLRQNDFANALKFLQKSIATLVPGFADSGSYANASLSNTLSEFYLLKSLKLKAETFAHLYAARFQLGDLQNALSTYVLACDLIDQMRCGFREEGSKLFLGEIAVGIYNGALQTALKLGKITKQQQYDTQAFTLAEKSKAAVLTQLLQESRAKKFAGIPAQVLEKEKQLRVDLASLQTAIQKGRQAKQNKMEKKVLELEERYFARKGKYDELIAQIEKEYPKYFVLKYESQTAAVAELQAALDDQTALLEYFVGDSAISAFVVTKNRLEAFSLDKDSTFTATVNALANSFKNASSKATYLRDAGELYRMLIKPLDSNIADKSRWVIIPDGDLCFVPFEALLEESVLPMREVDYPDLPYVIKKHEISYHLSATLFLQSRRESYHDKHPSLFAGFAPVFGKAINNGRLTITEASDLMPLAAAPADRTSYLITRDGETLDKLAYTEQELMEIWAALGYDGIAYLHQDASEESFKANAKGHKYVHVATHGFINSENPKLSNLAFSQPQDDSAKEDGILFSGETYSLDLNADLLVLSACQTGAGKVVKGEGLMTLTRGFFYAGARNVVASLWKVYDEHTGRLMVAFYREIVAGKDYTAALRSAKLKMIADSATAAPQSWAGFVLLGR
jgi:CHAT domain-containing protein/tetratricopeptide (TPR) repeat protein